MIYLLDENAGEKTLKLKGERYKYLIKVRRHNLGDIISFRNKKSIDILHSYKIVSLESRDVVLELLESKNKSVVPSKNLHIGWCMIDTKSIEKVLPSLSEIGVKKISFIYCKRSQKNFKVDLKRFNRILEASMQQSGRSSYIEFEVFDNLLEFLKLYKDVKVFDFCDNVLVDSSGFESVLIGCEGGFDEKERELLLGYDSFRLDTPMVLRSESAVFAVASKILL